MVSGKSVGVSSTSLHNGTVGWTPEWSAVIHIIQAAKVNSVANRAFHIFSYFIEKENASFHSRLLITALVEAKLMKRRLPWARGRRRRRRKPYVI